jgi:hypothetical protein
MYKYGLIFVFLLLVGKSYSQTNKVEPEMMFRDTLHNFGKIWYQGEAIYEFTFKNTGKSPLVIEGVRSSCGCTVPEWGKAPVMPKGKGVIKVKYDTNKIGEFQKTVKIFSNAVNSPVTLLIMGVVRVTD